MKTYECAVAILLVICVSQTIAMRADARVFDVVLANGDTLKSMVLDSVRGETLFATGDASDTSLFIDDIAVLSDATGPFVDAGIGGLVGAGAGTLAWIVLMWDPHINRGWSSMVYTVGIATSFGSILGLVASRPEDYDLRFMVPQGRRKLLTSLCDD